MSIWGRERLDQHLRTSKARSQEQPNSALIDMMDLFLEALFHIPSRAVGRGLAAARRFLPRLRRPQRIDVGPAMETLSRSSLDILVIDSLNVIGAENQPRFFDKFLSRVRDSAKLVVFVLDSIPGGRTHPHWEFVCDIVVRTGYQSPHNYYTRSVEIVKARYQSHVWGQHQLKIYAKPSVPDDDAPNRTEQMFRGHPFRTEGGVFIFPSLHYYLSLYKRRGAAEEGRRDAPLLDVDPGCPGLRNVVMFPKGRCTAFVGARGGHKSHLGYVHLLNQLRSDDEAALVISLREDEQRSYSTMQGILRTTGGKDIQTHRTNDQLEVLYYHPGYITPEEFFHRMFISVQRLKVGVAR